MKNGFEIDERIAPRLDEPVLNKLYASAFFGTPFPSLLASHQCDSVIVTGASTSGCVRATTVDALQYGDVVSLDECIRALEEWVAVHAR